MPSRCCTQYVSKAGRPSSGPRTRKGQPSFQFPRRVILKNVLTIRQLHSSSMLVRSCLKSCMLDFSSMQTKNCQTSTQGLEKAEEPEIKLSTFTGSYRKPGNFRKTSTFVSPTMLKPLTVWIITNCGKLLEKWEYRTHWFKIEKWVQLGCLMLPCLFNLYLSISWEMPGCDSYKLESR